MISDGSVCTFCSKITLPASSAKHTDVSFTDTSRPTKCAISSLLPRCSRSPDLDPFIATEGDARSASKAEPQPPRYTIFGPNLAVSIRSRERAGSGAISPLASASAKDRSPPKRKFKLMHYRSPRYSPGMREGDANELGPRLAAIVHAGPSLMQV